MMRMLQKKEKKNWSRMLAGGGGGGGSISSMKKKESNGRYYDNNGNSNPIITAAAPSVAQLDYNNHNIHLDYLEYTYGSSIAVSFNLTSDLTISTEVLQRLNTNNIDLWTLGIYMKMANPQGGELPPIVTVQPNIVSLDSSTTSSSSSPTTRALRHHRSSSSSSSSSGDAILDHSSSRLLDTANNATGYYYEIIPEEIPENLPPPILNYACSAIIPSTTTSAAVLDPTKYGTGFDIFLLDEFGRAIVGPATFYMIPTPAMTDALVKAEARVPNNGLAKFEKAKKEKKEKKKTKQDKVNGNKSKDDKTTKTNNGKGKEYDVNEDPSTVGLNSGVNGEMVIATTPKLAEYVLNTTQEYYDVGDTVVVMYNIKSDFDVLLGSGGGSRRMMQNNKKPSTAPTTKTLPKTTTKKPISSIAGPPPVPVSPPPLDRVDYKGFDGADVKLFTLGLYQRMANPQDGQLKPLLSVPLCSSSSSSSDTNSGLSSCTKTVEQLKLGSVSFVVDSATVSSNGYGYDVWILNGAGVGVAGPHTFYINIPATVLGEEL